jgi:hypothetical protein
MRAPFSGQERMADLLGRYPRVSAEEVREMLTFMCSGPHVDVILLSNDDRLGPKLDAFIRGHRAQLRASWSEAAAVIAGILTLMIALWMIMEALNGFSSEAASHLAGSLSVGRLR